MMLKMLCLETITMKIIASIALFDCIASVSQMYIGLIVKRRVIENILI